MARTRGRWPEAVWRTSPGRISPLHNVPVTTTPIPLRTNARSTGKRANPADLPSGESAARASSSSKSFSTPSPVAPLTRNTSRCSLVWGITPSSAATTSKKASTPVAPETMFLTKRSWPGTSTRLARLPLGRSNSAYPGTMEMPLRCSSSRRSVSVPVMYLTSVVLPWSTCPAVPIVRDILCSPASPMCFSDSPDHGLLVARQERPHVQPQPPLAHSAHHRRVRGAQLLGQGFRVGSAHSYGEGGNLVSWQRTTAAAGYRWRDVHFQARYVAPQVLGEVGGPFFHLGD